MSAGCLAGWPARSWAKLVDLLKHLPIVAIVLGISTAQMIRIMRSNLLDELRKPAVMTARARGLSEARVIMKYPERVAQSFVSVSATCSLCHFGCIIVSLVEPTDGPLLLKALIAQDVSGGTIVLLLRNDGYPHLHFRLLLMWADPRG
jgi:peptide/nickel transport system permease protein